MLRTVTRFGYVPFMLLILNGVAIWLVASGAGYWTLGVVLLVALGVAHIAERVLPVEDDWNHEHGDTPTNIIHAIIYEISNINAVLLLPIIAWFIPWQGIWPTEWPLVLQVLMAIVVADCTMSLLHWLSHRVEFLWKLHSVHHGQERLYGFNGLVRHPLHQTIDLALGTLPLVLAGMPVEVALLLGVAISIQLIVQHSNVDFNVGPARNWLSIGELHRLHHVNWGKEGDVNFALFFTVWDRMLGTFNPQPKRTIVPGDFGIDTEPNFPKGYVGQFLYPFQEWLDKRDAAKEAAGSEPNARKSQPIEPAE